ncbi:MAG: hypothetical protein RR573_00060 [Oscillospiraceae bacterium]
MSGTFKKLCIKTFTILIILPLLLVPAYAANEAEQARALLSELKRGDVSFVWENDVKENSADIEQMAQALTNADSEQIAQMRDIKDDMLDYINALYKLNGKSMSEIDLALEQSGSIKNQASREKALHILQELQKGDVSPVWHKDISDNEAKISEMMELVSNYTVDELSCVSAQERKDMMAYFRGLHNYLGYDERMTETLLSSTDAAFAQNISVPMQDNKAMPQQYIAPKITVIQQPIKTEASAAASSILSVILATMLCVMIMGLLTWILKCRAENK